MLNFDLIFYKFSFYFSVFLEKNLSVNKAVFKYIFAVLWNFQTYNFWVKFLFHLFIKIYIKLISVDN